MQDFEGQVGFDDGQDGFEGDSQGFGAEGHGFGGRDSGVGHGGFVGQLGACEQTIHLWLILS